MTIRLDDKYTKSLLHFDGADASTTFTDESGKTWTTNGNAKIFKPKIDTGCSFFDGSGDYTDTPDSVDFDIGSGDFTIDFWIKPNATGVQFLSGQSDAPLTGSSISFHVALDASNKPYGGIYSGSTQYRTTAGSTALSIGTWYHIAIVRNGNTITYYLNGTSEGTVNVTGITANNSSNKFSIGRLGEYSGNYFNGWIDEFRFSKGIARWTANFTPQSSPYIYDSVYDKALLHFETNFSDDSGKTWTANGNAVIQNTKFNGCGVFDGTGDWIDTPDSTDFTLGSGDFTIDFFIKKNADGAQFQLCGQSDSLFTATSTSVTIDITSANHLRITVYTGSTPKTATQSGTILTGAFHHLAFVRNGNTLSQYIDGVADGSVDVTGVTVNDSSNKWAIGRLGEYASQNFNGWIDEFRISKGIARWTGNFTPPTRPYFNYNVIKQY